MLSYFFACLLAGLFDAIRLSHELYAADWPRRKLSQPEGRFQDGFSGSPKLRRARKMDFVALPSCGEAEKWILRLSQVAERLKSGFSDSPNLRRARKVDFVALPSCGELEK